MENLEVDFEERAEEHVKEMEQLFYRVYKQHEEEKTNYENTIKKLEGPRDLKIHLLAEVWEVLHNAREDANDTNGVVKDEDYAKALLNIELLSKIEQEKLRTNFFD